MDTSMTVASSPNPNTVELITTLLPHNANGMLEEKSLSNLLKDPDLTHGIRIAYKLEKGVTVDVLKENFGAFVKLPETKQKYPIRNASYLLGYTHMTIKEQLNIDEDPHMFVLEYYTLDGNSIITQVHINTAHTYCIGRSPAPSQDYQPIIIAQDCMMSRTHCKLSYDASNKTWLIQDCGSVNGIFLKLPQGPIEIGWDQSIRLGKFTIVYFSQD